MRSLYGFALAWLHDHPDIELAPFLNITAPTLRSGKTTLLGIVEQFVPRPLPLVDAKLRFPVPRDQAIPADLAG